jgi:ferredoxin
MTVTVDLTRCIGSGMCTKIAPEIFALGGEGKAVVLMNEPSTPEHRDAATDAAECCPTEAISLHGLPT